MNQHSSKILNFIVVPEGLMGDAQGKVIGYPSFVFRQVLDEVGRQVREKDTVYLAPGNSFGGNIPEQEIAKNYLLNICDATVIAPESEWPGYVDTRGNAFYLRMFLEGVRKWPLVNTHLFMAAPHTKRSAICFRKEGFLISGIHPVNIEIGNEMVVRRLWYYKKLFWHRFYEAGAIIIDALRPPAQL